MRNSKPDPAPIPVVPIEELVANVEDQHDGIAENAKESAETPSEPETPIPPDFTYQNWSPSAGSKTFRRLNESHMVGSWSDLLVDKFGSETGDQLAAEHRFQIRPLVTGEWVKRPASFLGDDEIHETKEGMTA